MRIVLVIQYDGKNFCGWQIQPNVRTVQETVENAIFELAGQNASVTASGRTDSGVHAFCQVAHFDSESSIPPENYARALNVILPSDVKIVKSMQAPKDFHARFSAKKKTYRYTFYVSDVELPLFEPYATRIIRANIDKMKEASQKLVGEHDFACFLASNSSVKDTVRTIYSCKVTKKNNLIYIDVCGNGFLYNMVRTIAGTLLSAGEGKILPSDIEAILKAKTRAKAGKTMPAKGLSLIKVEYKGIKIPKF